MTDQMDEQPLFPVNESPYRFATDPTLIEQDLADRPPPRDGDARADWLLSQLRIMNADRERVISQYQGEIDRLQERMAEVLTPIDDQIERRHTELLGWHRANIREGAARTVKLPHGRVAAIKQPPRFKVIDKEAARQWVSEHAPECLAPPGPQMPDWEAVKAYVNESGHAAAALAQLPDHSDKVDEPVEAEIIPGVAFTLKPTACSAKPAG